ncbi:hypothetical protein A2U01_0091866, partial [Trifolium medium]|nr:hypothetical protein [Trifolium medium]
RLAALGVQPRAGQNLVGTFWFCLLRAAPARLRLAQGTVHRVDFC